MNTRRDALKAMLFGAGYVGVRALATGLPASFFLNPRKAFAAVDAGGAAACNSAATAAAQYFIMSTSGNGDPINASVPGTYVEDTPAAKDIIHSSVSSMAPTKLTVAGATHYAAAPWAALPQSVLDKTTFWHLMTGSIIHPEEPEVLRLMDATTGPEMLPSILSKLMAPCLGTIQTEPVCIGASTPSESLTFNGEALPIIPPLSLKETLTNTPGALTNLQKIRDNTMNSLYGMYSSGTPAQKAYVDALAISQTEARSISQTLLNNLSMIADNTVASQIQAAVTLIQMGVSPLISIHIPFGGDNHSDAGLADETTQTTGTDMTLGVTGVPAIAALMSALATNKFANGTALIEKVTFMSLNVFGRTLVANGGTGTSAANGRGHNENHQVSITIGNAFKPGVVGGIMSVANDIGATNIDTSSGGVATGSSGILASNTLQAFGATLLSGVGVSQSEITAQIPTGTVITGALAS
jgi:hypothetical protein